MIDPESFGTADYVSEIRVTHEVYWGGFRALFVPDGQAILIQAERWRGQQPRLALQAGDTGYKNWIEMLKETPERPFMIRCVGSRLAARNPIDQWLTHGPSPLL
jgi:hypothetical protein